MPSDKPVTQEAPPPGPRRRKWLRRLLILGCCLLFLFIVWAILQLWLGSAFQREVEALRTRLRTLGYL